MNGDARAQDLGVDGESTPGSLTVRHLNTQSIHGGAGGAHACVERGGVTNNAVELATGLTGGVCYSADYVNQIFDHSRDAIVMIPVFAYEVEPRKQIVTGTDFLTYEWCERDEAAARLLWSGQRWSIRHIDDVIGEGGPQAEFYRIR